MCKCGEPTFNMATGHCWGCHDIAWHQNAAKVAGRLTCAEKRQMRALEDSGIDPAKEIADMQTGKDDPLKAIDWKWRAERAEHAADVARATLMHQADENGRLQTERDRAIAERDALELKLRRMGGKP